MAQEKRYDHREVEQKWQQYWDANETFRAENPGTPPSPLFGKEGEETQKPKYYILDMFPYPSGAGLHVGHPEGYTATDIIARYKRMKGFNVLHPMGWDAFGLPAENYAIKTGEHPEVTTKRNIATFKRQIKSLGFSYDWSREFSTTDSKYYHWTQWIFLQMYKTGLLYEKQMPMNWCPSCRIVAANEEVENGLHERCNTPVEKRNLRQWMFRITDYAERLLNDLDELKDWPEKIIAMQRNWIGKSEGAEVEFDTGVLRGAEYFELSVGHSAVYHLTFNTEEGVILSDNDALHLQNIFRKIAREDNFYISEGVIMPDHVHLVIADPEEREMGKLMNRIKGVSSRLLKITRGLTPGLSVRDTDSKGNEYARIWRDGYHFEPIRTGADLERVMAYVKQNPEREGLEAQYRTFEDRERITVYTTRPDTLFGATYMVLAPEHELVETITTPEQKSAVQKYLEQTNAKSDLERTELSKEKTGVFTGAYAINPVNNELIPIWIADYVLASYGTGAIMAVPAHDERDFAFAQSFDLPIRAVVEPSSGATSGQEAFAEEGIVIDSDFLNGLPTAAAKEKMIQWLEEKGVGKRQINYKLRDWIFTRQRYWGEPIPLVRDTAGTIYPLDESELPVTLPDTDSFLPTASGESPLAKIRDWVEVRGDILANGSIKLSPSGSTAFFRETSTTPNWAGSNWYWLRFMDPQNETEPWSKAAEAYWGPVDLYVGGAEHAVLHLLYSRFWHKVFYDMGLTLTKEPFKKLMNQGLILAEDGQKMSKSLGNVVNPDEIVEKYGADTLRMYEMFMGPFEQSKAWNTDAVDGMYRFLQRIWRIFQDKPVSAEVCPGAEFRRLVHKSVKKITEDIEGFKFNTAVSQLMILVNAIQKLELLPKSGMVKFVQLLAPFAPHLAEEIWQLVLGYSESVSKSTWPTWDEALTVDNEIELAVQVSGKLRATIRVPAQIAKEQAIALAKTHENVLKHLEGKEIIKEIFVPGKIVNLVVKG